jgi:hypothetical protein
VIHGECQQKLVEHSAVTAQRVSVHGASPAGGCLLVSPRPTPEDADRHCWLHLQIHRFSVKYSWQSSSWKAPVVETGLSTGTWKADRQAHPQSHDMRKARTAEMVGGIQRCCSPAPGMHSWKIKTEKQNCPVIHHLKPIAICH